MKKIVGILGMAAVLASGAFAAEPTADFKIAEFKGSAEFGWKADFHDSDAVRMGMFNSTDANLKLGFVTAGDKATTGDGVWGEIGIKFEKPLEWNFTKDSKKETPPTPDFAAPAVTTAKIHFVDGDFSVALNILQPGLKYDGYSPFAAVPTTCAVTTIDANSDKQLKAGFGLEFAMKDMFAFNFKFMDDGVTEAKGVYSGTLAKDKKYGMAFDAALKAVKNLDARVAAAFNFDTDYVGFLGDAAYKLALDSISDKTYLKFGAGYSYNNSRSVAVKENKDVNSLAAGVMFGWGAEGVEAKLDYIADKVNEGFSVSVNNDLGKAVVNYKDYKPATDKGNTTKIAIGLYDQSLFNMLGIEEFGKLQTGFEYVLGITAGTIEHDGYKVSTTTYTNRMALAMKYAVKADIFDIALHAGLQSGTANDTFGITVVTSNQSGIPEEYKKQTSYDSIKPTFKFGVSVGTKEIIDNTNVYVAFEGEADANKDKDQVTKAEIKVGTKISF